jgi:hypothetical protein
MKNLSLVIVAIGLQMCTRTGADSAGKIVGGQNASASRYSGIAKLIVGDTTCTAARIAQNLWLTAAHCTQDQRATPGNIKLIFGDDQTITVDEVILPNRLTSDETEDPNAIVDREDIIVSRDVSILRTEETAGKVYSIAPFDGDVTATEIIGYGTKSNCPDSDNGDAASNFAEGGSPAICEKLTARNNTSRLAIGKLKAAQLLAARNQYVSYVTPIAPDRSGTVGPGIGDGGGPLIQDGTIVGVLWGASFPDEDVSTRSGITRENQMVSTYTNAQADGFCEALRNAGALDANSDTCPKAELAETDKESCTDEGVCDKTETIDSVNCESADPEFLLAGCSDTPEKKGTNIALCRDSQSNTRVPCKDVPANGSKVTYKRDATGETIFGADLENIGGNQSLMSWPGVGNVLGKTAKNFTANGSKKFAEYLKNQVGAPLKAEQLNNSGIQTTKLPTQ